MARVKVALPAHWGFQTQLRVRVTDLNYGGHVGNDTVLGLMHEGRVRWFNNMGYNNEVNAIEGHGIIMADAAVEYRAEALLGMEIEMLLGATDFNKYGFDVIHLLRNASTGQEVARGKAGILCYDYTAKALRSLPPAFKQKLMLPLQS